MFKNFIILIQFFIIFSLMVQKPQNLDIIVKDVATAKDMVVDGAEYLHKTFDKEFSVHEEVFKEEHGETPVKESPVKQFEGSSSKNPFNKSDYSPNEVKIIEETLFNEG